MKAFEARLDKYSARLLKTANTCFLSEIIESEDGSGDVNLSHEIVIDFIKLSGCQHASIRSSNQSNIDSMARVVTEKIIPAVHGPLGWSPSLPGANPLDEESAKDTSATVSAAPSPKHRLGSSSIQHHTPFGSDNLGEESDSFSRINEGLAGLKEKEKEVLMSNCKEVRTAITYHYHRCVSYHYHRCVSYHYHREGHHTVRVCKVIILYPY